MKDGVEIVRIVEAFDLMRSLVALREDLGSLIRRHRMMMHTPYIYGDSFRLKEATAETGSIFSGITPSFRS